MALGMVACLCGCRSSVAATTAVFVYAIESAYVSQAEREKEIRGGEGKPRLGVSNGSIGLVGGRMGPDAGPSRRC